MSILSIVVLDIPAPNEAELGEFKHGSRPLAVKAYKDRVDLVDGHKLRVSAALKALQRVADGYDGPIPDYEHAALRCLEHAARLYRKGGMSVECAAVEGLGALISVEFAPSTEE